MERYRIRFLPSEREFFSDGGKSILDVAMEAGVHINASCGGNGACGKCRIEIVEGAAVSGETHHISRKDEEKGVRLACLTEPRSDMVIRIPRESQMDREALSGTGDFPHRLSVHADEIVAGWSDPDPLVIHAVLSLPEPTLSDNVADFDRLARELEGLMGAPVETDVKVLKRLGANLRTAGWTVTVTAEAWRTGFRVLRVEPGDRGGQRPILCIDVGTTTVCGELFDPRSGQTMAEYAEYNEQIRYGEDVVSRIFYARRKGGLKKLQKAVVGTINAVIEGLLKAGNVGREDISGAILAGNTTMTHLLYGVDPTPIMLDPYTPAASVFPIIRATEIDWELGSHVPLFPFPLVSSYIGGDIVAGVLASGMWKSGDLTLYIDIGTNGEIVLGNDQWLVCASCSAGPAFEGGGIRSGMRAGAGAIEQITIHRVTLEPMIMTIGKTKPAGICGSGLIDCVSEMIESGLIDRRGRFVREKRTERVREGVDGFEYVLCFAPETSVDRDIVLTEADLENLLRTKAALYAGCRTLLKEVGSDFGDLRRVVIAGGFGHYIDPGKAQTIGLLPELSPEVFEFLGNGSLLGVKMAAHSRTSFDRAVTIARSMTTIELSNNSGFMDEFMAAMFLPHTDERAFPATVRRIERQERGRGL